MALLLVEAAEVTRVFDERWRARLGGEPPRGPQRASFDHFPFLLYEYFATAPMEAARRIALAARAASVASHLELGDDPDPSVLSWLRSLAREQLETMSPAATATAFATIAGEAGSLPLVHESQAHLYAALALHEGCLFWRDDYVRGRRSPVVARLSDEMGGGAAVESPDAAGRRFYYGGLAERVLDEAGEHLCRALAAVTDLPPVAWGAMISGRLDDVTRLRADLHRIRHQQLRRLDVRAAPPVRPRSEPPPHQLEAAARSAAAYLRQEQAPDGRWGDFMLLGQQSTSWVTGYVGWNLAESHQEGGDLAAAARWLVTHQLPGGGWGYNHHWPVDVDSLANVILFLARRDDVAIDCWAPALERLLASQHADGGFTTILDPEAWLVRFRTATPGVSGWTASHPCVTAVAALLLARLDGVRERAAAGRALDYLLAHQRPEGCWGAYWWMGGLYTTCRVLEAVLELDRPGSDACLSRARAWILGRQRPDGGWAAGVDQRSAAFHTALAVQALRALPCTRAVESAAAAGLQWLVGHQRPDGSWPAAPILRVPRPDSLAPWDRTIWTESVIGLDVVVPDWRRLFSTATALRALYSWVGGREDVAGRNEP